MYKAMVYIEDIEGNEHGYHSRHRTAADQTGRHSV